MNKLIIITISLINITAYTFSQNFDVRKTKWGMTIKDVLNSELPLTPYKQIDTTFQSTFVINNEVIFKNVIIGNLIANIYYYFSNEKLVEITYKFNNNKDTIYSLYDKVLKTLFIYNILTNEKSMNKLYCWTYDNASYKVFSGKTDCDFANKEVVDNVEKTGKAINYVNKAMYVLNNKRTNASIEFNIKGSSAKNTIGCINFTPSTEVNKELKINDF